MLENTPCHNKGRMMKSKFMGKAILGRKFPLERGLFLVENRIGSMLLVKEIDVRFSPFDSFLSIASGWSR